MEWTYTAVFYAFSCFVFYHLIYTENILKPYLDDLTLDNINYVLMTSLSVLIVLLNPLLASRAREKREEYFKLWREYQIQYEQYTIAKLDLVGHGLPFIDYSLRDVARSIVQMTTVATSNRVDGGGKGVESRVSCFVDLWRKLSDMSGGLMDTGRGLYEFNFFVQSVIVVQALYGIVALYIGRHHSIIHYYVYFPTAAWSILNLVVLCEAAYSVTNQVGFKTNISIQLMACNKFNLETQEQIFTALKTIQSHTPVITVSGYFTMDRTYILTYLGVAVSYIIVLAQFKIGTS
eukprot:XP_016661963.1 PREDICTED: uncharacterized protein LOC100568871 isoform X3 [Acyrthosiphon pisum]